MLTFKVINVMKSQQNVKLSHSSDRWSQELLKRWTLNSISPGCVRSPLFGIFSAIFKRFCFLQVTEDTFKPHCFIAES